MRYQKGRFSAKCERLTCQEVAHGKANGDSNGDNSDRRKCACGHDTLWHKENGRCWYRGHLNGSCECNEFRPVNVL